MAGSGDVPRRFVWLLTLACGLTVANLYYTQPLLASIAGSFHVPQASTGVVVSATQVGYAIALLVFVPLGDIVRRRPLVCGLLALDVLALAASAAAPSLQALEAAGFAVGLTSVVVQILVPFAASLASEEQRNRVIGMLLSGMLLGVLLSRIFAGLVAQVASWRAVYLLAAVFMLSAAVMLYRLIGPRKADLRITYRQQMRAIASVAMTQPVLRRRSIIGACIYAAFNSFWTTAAFLLAGAPYFFNQATIGLFGLVGVAGALTSNVAGRYLTASRQRTLSGLMLGALVASFVAMTAGRRSFLLLVAAVLVMDAAVQGVHLLNQSVIYALTLQARARLTTVYMTSYFIGGAAGSAAGSLGYRFAGWPGACLAGAAFALLGLAVWVTDARRAPSSGQPGSPRRMQEANSEL